MTNLLTRTGQHVNRSLNCTAHIRTDIWCAGTWGDIRLAGHTHHGTIPIPQQCVTQSSSRKGSLGLDLILCAAMVSLPEGWITQTYTPPPLLPPHAKFIKPVRSLIQT